MSEAPREAGVQDGLPEISGYRLVRVLGRGGMSTVYLARQLSLDRDVAIKAMQPEALADEVSRRRFENEARTIARLEHPHIVGIYEVARTRAGLPFYAMPHLPRGHLAQRDFTKDPQRIRDILRALLSALGYAHARGVIHRDVKAENVLFDDAERPLLADFGIALRRGFGPRVTTTGLAVGSTAYMAPEQARGEEVDHCADLYALGVVAWEMLTGSLPFQANDALSMAMMHAQDPVPRLPPHLRHWQKFLDRALSKVPAKRYRDANHMQEALDAVPARDAVNTAEIAARALQAGAAARRMPKVAWVIVGLVVAAGAGVLLRQGSGDAAPQFFRAQAGTERALPVPGATPGASALANPDDAMLRAAPESRVEDWLARADAQLRQRRWTTPAGDNAYESLTNAWQEDPNHLAVAPKVAALMKALSEEAAREIGKGNTARAKTLLESAQRIAVATRADGGEAARAMRKRVAAAVGKRVDAAAAQFDREAALREVEAAKGLALTTAELEPLRKRARAIAQAGERVRDPIGELLLVREGQGLVAAATRAVSRDEYAAFANATGRPETLCRERASLLRILDKRTWQDPGFEQSGSDPVVCVSYDDARAYATWAGNRHGKRYRVPTAAEIRNLASAPGGKRVAEWNDGCGASCAQRQVHGTSWRGKGGRAMEANRGYDDVGFRLVREP